MRKLVLAHIPRNACGSLLELTVGYSEPRDYFEVIGR